MPADRVKPTTPGEGCSPTEEEDPMAEAYCVKDKKKVEIKNPTEDHDEERQAGHQGHLPRVRRQRLPHRRLTHPRREAPAGPSTPGSRDPRGPVARSRAPAWCRGSRDSGAAPSGAGAASATIGGDGRGVARDPRPAAHRTLRGPRQRAPRHRQVPHPRPHRHPGPSARTRPGRYASAHRGRDAGRSHPSATPDPHAPGCGR